MHLQMWTWAIYEITQHYLFSHKIVKLIVLKAINQILDNHVLISNYVSKMLCFKWIRYIANKIKINSLWTFILLLRLTMQITFSNNVSSDSLRKVMVMMIEIIVTRNRRNNFGMRIFLRNCVITLKFYIWKM